MIGEKSAQRFCYQTQGEFAGTGQVQFSCECNVAVGGLSEVPVRLKIAVQVGPAVASSDVAT